DLSRGQSRVGVGHPDQRGAGHREAHGHPAGTDPRGRVKETGAYRVPARATRAVANRAITRPIADASMSSVPGSGVGKTTVSRATSVFKTVPSSEPMVRSMMS